MVKGINLFIFIVSNEEPRHDRLTYAVLAPRLMDDRSWVDELDKSRKAYFKDTI